ncbi:MAG TPA: GAF and ANTAR domain-containing protein [Actinomycetes bacterium]
MTREQRLALVFVELADTLVAQFDVIDFLQTLTERCVELLGADAAGLMLADQRGHLRVVASSAESARQVEIFELQHSEGPCLDCFHSGQQIVNLDEGQMRDRWPSFAAEAVELGFRSAHALPMRLRDDVIGAINLFTRTNRRLSDDDIAVGQGMADVATIGLLQERVGREKDVLAEQLQLALNSRLLIEQAKGVLAERSRITPTEAFVVMRSYARRQNRTLTSVAAAVVDHTLQAAELGAR